MRNYLGALLVLLILSICLVSCEYIAPKHEHEYSPSYDETSHFQKCACGEISDKADHSLEWVIDKEPTHRVTGLKHKECSSCGYIADENTVIETTRNEDGTMKIDDELLAILLDYVHYTYGGYDDIKEYSLEDVIDMSKGSRTPLLIEFDEKDSYYVCAYYTHSHETDYEEIACCCCFENYVWVGFDTKDEIPEIYKNEEFLFAVQMTPEVSCRNLRTDETDIATEHYMIYEPEFEKDFNVAPEALFNTYMFCLAQDSEHLVYFTSTRESYRANYPICIEINGEIYLHEYFCIYSVNANGERNEIDRELYYGKYYDELMAIMNTDLYSETHESPDGNYTLYYGLFKLEDFVDIIKG